MDVEQSFTKINTQVEPHKKSGKDIPQNELSEIVINLFDLIDNIYHDSKKSFMLSGNTKKKIAQQTKHFTNSIKNVKSDKEYLDKLSGHVNSSIVILANDIDKLCHLLEVYKTFIDENTGNIKKYMKIKQSH